MTTHAAGEPTSPGRQAVILLGSVIAGVFVGSVVGAPFDIDVGAGHAIFHVVAATSIALAALWLRRHGTTHRSSRLAQWSAAALAVGQFAEGIAAAFDGTGDTAGHDITGLINLAVLQPLVLVAVVILTVRAIAGRRSPRQ